MTKRDLPTVPPPPNEQFALEIETRADRLASMREQLELQEQAFRSIAARLRGDAR